MDSQDSYNISRTMLASFKYAFSGVKQALKTERNLRIHFILALCVCIVAGILEVSRQDWVLLLILIGLVIAFEMMNTAIEAVVDLVVGANYHPLAKKAKDIAAAGVLTIAILAAIAGILILYPYLPI